MTVAAVGKKIEHFRAAEEALIAKGGNAAGYFCRQFPAELLAGLGFEPVRICSSDPLSESEGGNFVRPDACPRCKSIIGGLSLGKAPYSNLRMIAGPSTCDMMRRTLELVAEKFCIPVFQIHHPATRTENSRKFFTAEIASCVDEISAKTGRAMDVGKALSFFTARRECAKILRALSLSAEISQSMIHPLSQLFSFADPKRLLKFIKEMNAEIPRQKIKGIIAIAGSPFMHDAVEISLMLEEKGFGVVNLTCTGIDQFDALINGRSPLREGRNTVAKFAEICFNSHPCIRARPNNDVHKRIMERTRQLRAMAVIYRTFKFCDLWSVERIRFRDSIGIPSIPIDSDSQSSISEAIRTRIDAFIESIEVNRV